MDIALEYTQLNRLYNDYKRTIFSFDNRSEEKLAALSDYVHEHGDNLASDLAEHSEHAELYKKITVDLGGSFPPELLKDFQTIKSQADLLSTAASLNNLARFLSYQLDIKETALKSRPEKLLMAIELLKEKPEYAPIISKVAVAAFNFRKFSFKKLDEAASIFEERELQLAIIAHFVNATKIPLADLNLSMDDLNFIAPHLHYVNCRRMAFNDEKELNNFINKCSNITKLVLFDNEITTIRVLPNSLQELECMNCNALTEINLSNNQELRKLGCYTCSNLTLVNVTSAKSLQELSCYSCVKLAVVNASHSKALKIVNLLDSYGVKELHLSHCEALKKLECTRRSGLTKLDVSYCTALKSLDCYHCSRLTELNISHCSAMELLLCLHCYSLSKLNLSYCLSLRYLNCSKCTSLVELNLTLTPELQDLNCSECSQLETILSNGLPNCRFIDYSNCPSLAELPQLPPSVHAVSYHSQSDVSFRVHPNELKTKPLEVIGHLGKLILMEKQMPNIVFIQSLGMDGGGLRRQLVTSLMQNLFEKGSSPLKLLPHEEGVEGTFPLLKTNNKQQIEAFKTIGALIALAAHAPLPLGRFLRRGFFHALLSLEKEELETLDPDKPLDKDLAKKIYSLAVYGDRDGEIDLKEMKKDPIMLPIAWAAKGFRVIANPKQFRDRFNVFMNQVTGAEVTWDNFDKVSLYDGDEQGKIKGYFKTFFERNPHKVNDMVELFTGSRTLGVETIKINIERGLKQESLFSMTTCNSQVNIPPYATYALFEQKLLKSIEHTLSQFGRA